MFLRTHLPQWRYEPCCPGNREADQAVAQVSLATTEKGYTLPTGTQVPDHTDWHNLVFYRGLAKVVETVSYTHLALL